jgi:hypothetical protein
LAISALSRACKPDSLGRAYRRAINRKKSRPCHIAYDRRRRREGRNTIAGIRARPQEVPMGRVFTLVVK